MSKPMSKKGKRALIALVIILLVGGCFSAVALYAHHELTKPKFEMPDATLPSVQELPTTKAEVIAYVQQLYNEAVSADDVEGSWHTDAKVKDYAEQIQTPFSDADESVILYIWEHAGDQIRDNVYPKADKVLKCADEGVFNLALSENDVLDFTAERGRYNDRNEFVDDDYYFITLTLSPEWIDTDEIRYMDAFAKFKEILSSALTVNNADIEPQGAKLSFKINRPYNELESLDITRSYHIRASVTPVGEYAAIAGETSGAVDIELPYESTEKISFYYYGAYFTKACAAVKPGDWQALPARVHVHENEENDKFSLTFTSSDPEALSIDEDGVMRVQDAAGEETVTVEMKLEYDGHVYTHQLTVYITELEVKTDE